ncbi:MAG: helix-turn-helix domain-containing protein [Pseudomonadota bacterium]|nr:helix-turn-helix domain-containing protein [Pseudomonadota bacterium]
MLLDSTTSDIFLDIFDSAPAQEIGPGEILVHAGASAEKVFNIIDGTLMVSRIGRDGRRQVLSFLFRDHFVGLSATENYFFTVESLTAAKVACCSRSVLERRLEKDPFAERAFLNMVFRVLENSLDLIYSLGQRSALERLAVFLLYLRNRKMISRQLEDSSKELESITLPMSRQDIGDFLGLKKETVSRSFTQLDQKNLIRRKNNRNVKIINLDELRELGGIQDFASPLRVSKNNLKC